MHGQELKDGNKLFITAILMLNFGSRILNFNNQTFNIVLSSLYMFQLVFEMINFLS